MRIALLAGTLITVLAVSAGCDSGTTSTPAEVRITAANSCPSDEAQDLTLSGSLTGHIVCSIAPPACHRIHGPQSPGVQVLVLATSGPSPVTVRIAFGNDHVGVFAATPMGDEPNLDQQGVTVTGIGTWRTPAHGGTMAVLVETPPSLSAQGRVSGSLDVKLTSNAHTAQVKGSWACFKTLAGGDGWSSA
jgi:hypothetical protein